MSKIMPRVITYEPTDLKGLYKRTKVTITWSRDEVLARVKLANTFKHKRTIAKQYRQMKEQ